MDHNYQTLQHPLSTKQKTYELEYPLVYNSKIIKTKQISTFFAVVKPQNNDIIMNVAYGLLRGCSLNS